MMPRRGVAAGTRTGSGYTSSPSALLSLHAPSQRRDCRHNGEFRQIFWPQSKLLRILVRVFVFFWLARAPRIKAGLTAVDRPNACDRRVAKHLDAVGSAAGTH